jgi:hypothetical protein
MVVAVVAAAGVVEEEVGTVGAGAADMTMDMEREVAIDGERTLDSFLEAFRRQACCEKGQ